MAQQTLAAINSRIQLQTEDPAAFLNVPLDSLTTNSTQLESSNNVNDQIKALILEVTYDVPAFRTVAEFRAAFEAADKGAHRAAESMFRLQAEVIEYCAMVRS
jgi:hypothetical protein